MKDRKNSLRSALLAMMLFFILVPFGRVSAAPKRVILKITLAVPTALPALGDTLKWFAKNLQIASGGDIAVKLYEPGKLVPPFEILDAVSKGKINAGYSAAGYWQGKIPAASLFTAIPFGPEAPEYLAWLLHGNGAKLYQEMYDQAGYHVKVLPICIVAPETSGWFRKPVNSVEDLKGLRVRYAALGGQVMQKLGASVSLLPAGEVFPALEKNVLDAAEFSIPAVDYRLGLYKVAKYNYFPGWHQQASILELLINKPAWQKMSDRQRTLIETTAMASLVYSLAYSEAIEARIIKENAEKHGVKNMYWSDEMLTAFERAWQEVAAEQAAKDEFFKKVWLDLRTFRKEYASWKELAFLPRKAGK